MKILLVSLYFDPNAMAVRLLSSILKREFPEHTVNVLFLSHKGKPPRMDFDLETTDDLIAIQEFIAQLRPDVVGISLMSNYLPRAVQLSQAIRDVVDAKILWGGVHPTLKPEECTVHADLVFVGEAELALPAVIQRLMNNQPVIDIPGVWYRKDGKVMNNGVCPACEDLDSLPTPDYEFDTHFVFSPVEHRVISMRLEHILESKLAFYGGVPFHRVLTARGCSQACAYCINSTFRKILGVKKYIRQRSLESVIRELEYVAELGIFKRIMIIDDDFCLRSVDWLEEFAKIYKQKIALPLGCQATPGRVTREKIRLLKDAGVTNIGMGVQTGSDKLNFEVFQRRLSREQVLRAARILAEETPGIARGFDFLIRNPYETLSDKVETATLMLELPLPFVVRCYALTFFPGLPLTERAYHDGFLTDVRANSLYDYYGSTEENAWQEVLENAPNIPRENRTNLLAQLKEKPPATVRVLIETLKQAGAQKKRNGTPQTKFTDEKRNEIKQIDIQNNAGASNQNDLLKIAETSIKEEFERTEELTKGVDGRIAQEEAQLIYLIARDGEGDGEIVEIGSYQGYSTIWLASGSKGRGRERVYAIDPHNSPEHGYNEAICRENIKKAGVDDYVIPVIKSSAEASSTWDLPIRFLWIDGAHDYENARNDFLLWEKYLIPGGIIAFHDYLSIAYPGVSHAVEECIFNSQRFSVLGCVNTVIYAKKVERLTALERFNNEHLLKLLLPRKRAEESFHKAHELIQTKNFEEAKRILIKCAGDIRLFYSQKFGLVRLLSVGNALRQVGAYNEAEEIYFEVMDFKGTEPLVTEKFWALHGLGDIRLLQGRYKESEERLRESLSIESISNERKIISVLQLGKCYAEQGREDEAVKEYLKALSDGNISNRSRYRLFQKMGYTYLKQKKYRDAEHSFNDVLSLDGISETDRFYSLLGLGKCCLAQNKYIEAEKAFKEALTKDNIPDEKMAEVILDIGQCFKNQGKVEAAKKGYVYALSLKKITDRSRYRLSQRLGEIYLIDGRYKEAEQKFNEALSIKVISEQDKLDTVSALEKCRAASSSGNGNGENGLNKHSIYESLSKCYFGDNRHEKEITDHLPEILTGGKIFMDIGASLGQYSFFANKHMSRGRIIAVEADPVRFERLRDNCRKWESFSHNKLDARHAAVGDKDGKEIFYITNSCVSGAFFKREIKNSEVKWQEVEVECVTLDSLCKDFTPDVVKIDVEGADLRVLRGAKKILREGKTKFLIEVHGGIDPEGQRNPEEVFKFMESFGYRRINFYGRDLFVCSRTGKTACDNQMTTINRKRPHETIRKLHADEKMKSLKNLYKGQRCFIIGNGPSLNEMDLTKLKDEITFGVNSIFYNFSRMGFKPTFYVVEDKLVAEDRADEINALTGMTRIYGEYLKYCIKDSSEVIWANVIFDFSNYPGFPHFSKDASDRMWVGGTVSYLCMQLAYYMGFSEVYLIGFDHKYIIPGEAKVDGTVITSTSDDPNHFHPEYFGNGKRWHDPRLDRMEKAYKKAREAFELDGRKIYNASRGGELDIFPRIGYESIFLNNSVNGKMPVADINKKLQGNFRAIITDICLETVSECSVPDRFNALEVGCMFRDNEGLSTYKIASFLSNRSGKKQFVSIEYDPSHVKSAKEMLGQLDPCLLSEVIFLNGHSLDMIPKALQNMEDIDFASLDGGAHPEVCLQEFELVLNKLAERGLVYIDDVQEIAPSEAYPVPRPFGKATLILPYLVIAEYLKNRASFRDRNNQFTAGSEGVPYSRLVTDTSDKLISLIGDWEYLIVSSEKHKSMLVGKRKAIDVFKSKINKKGLTSFNLSHTMPETNRPHDIEHIETKNEDTAKRCSTYTCAGPVKSVENGVQTGNQDRRFSHLVLDYTRQCNSRCTYCSIWKTKNGPELGTDSIKKVFSSLQELGLSACYVTGGEPYISDKIVDIARLLKDYLPKSRISGATNAVQPAAILKRIENIRKMGVPLEVHVSINGSEKTHDATRGREGNWKNAVFLMKELKAQGINVVASMSLMPQTIKDLPFMQEFCIENNVRLMFSWVRQSVRYDTVDGSYSTWHDKFKHRLKEIEYLPDYFDCPGLSERLVVTPDGSVYPCEVYHPEILLGNIKNDAMTDMLNSPQTEEIMKRISSKGCYWCQGRGENEGSPKWMSMDCYRRHARQKTILARDFSQAVDMSPEESKRVVDDIFSERTVFQIPENSGSLRTSDEKKVRISVLICTYKNPGLLALTIESLLNQTLDRELFEIIVIDNNSNDSTKDVVSRYIDVSYLLETRQGLSFARNTGVQAARGDIIAFIDDDAEASPGWLASLLYCYDTNPNALAIGGKVLPMWEAEKPKWLNENYYRALSLVEYGEKAYALAWPERIIGTNCSFRSDVFQKFGLFDTCLGRIGTFLLGSEDTEIQQRIHREGYQVYYSPGAVVYHHVPATRMTRKYISQRSEGHKVTEQILALRAENNDEEIRKIVEDIRLRVKEEQGRIALNKKGEEMFLTGDVEGAKNIFERIIFNDPECVTALNNLGVTYWQMGDIEKTLKYFTKALKIDPNHRETVINCAEILKTNKDFETAGKICRTYLRSNPNDTDIHQLLQDIESAEGACVTRGKVYDQRTETVSMHPDNSGCGNSDNSKYALAGPPDNPLKADNRFLMIRDLKNKFHGQRCFIIGNGPSLRRTDLTLLKNEYTIGLNRIYLNYENMGFEPTFYCVVNPLVIEQFARDIDVLKSIKFVRSESKEFLKSRRNTFFMESYGAHDFNEDLSDHRWCEGWTVTYCAMQVAFYLGFHTVVLIGVDHNFPDSGDPNRLVTASGSDQNHFHPDYFGKGIKWHYPDLERSEKSYSVARKVYERNGRMILDATIGGKLTIFKRVDYNSIISTPVNVDTPFSLNKKGEELYINGDAAGAQEAFLKAMDMAPGYATAYNNLGVILWQAGDTVRASDYFLKALQIDPDDRAVVINCGGLLAGFNQIEEAKKLYASFLKKNPADEEISRVIAGLNMR